MFAARAMMTIHPRLGADKSASVSGRTPLNTIAPRAAFA